MPDAVDSILEDIDFERLRVTRPTRFAFVCGGRIDASAGIRPVSVRDYLLRHRGLQKRIGYPLVLAESAQQLYRDTSYSDLITFEEDIAKIAAIVLVISESAGALAELGAFASTPTIKLALRVLISEEHFAQESFVRYGPIERVIRIDRDRVGTYPWRMKSGLVVKTSIEPHFADISNFIMDHISAISMSESWSSIPESREFYVILWFVYLAKAVSPKLLYDLVRRKLPLLSDADIRNKIFSMKVAGWMDQISYAGRDFFYMRYDVDPFLYAFKTGALTDTARRKSDVRLAMRAIELPHRTVYQRVLEAQAGAL